MLRNFGYYHLVSDNEPVDGIPKWIKNFNNTQLTAAIAKPPVKSLVMNHAPLLLRIKSPLYKNGRHLGAVLALRGHVVLVGKSQFSEAAMQGGNAEDEKAHNAEMEAAVIRDQQ
jgi:hypothetical protein